MVSRELPEAGWPTEENVFLKACGFSQFNRNSKKKRAWRNCLAGKASSFVGKLCDHKIVCYKMILQRTTFYIL